MSSDLGSFCLLALTMVFPLEPVLCHQWLARAMLRHQLPSCHTMVLGQYTAWVPDECYMRILEIPEYPCAGKSLWASSFFIRWSLDLKSLGFAMSHKGSREEFAVETSSHWAGKGSCSDRLILYSLDQKPLGILFCFLHWIWNTFVLHMTILHGVYL